MVDVQPVEVMRKPVRYFSAQKFADFGGEDFRAYPSGFDVIDQGQERHFIVCLGLPESLRGVDVPDPLLENVISDRDAAEFFRRGDSSSESDD